MKSVTSDAFSIKRLRERVVVGDIRVTAMKGGVEAGHLQELRLARPDGSDCGQVVGLVQRSKR
jgi:hypothetical protein